jgi:hypothetical protein
MQAFALTRWGIQLYPQRTMSKGFFKPNSAHIELCRRRLVACLDNDDMLATGHAVARLRERYGSQVVDAAIESIAENFQDLSPAVRDRLVEFGFKQAKSDPELWAIASEEMYGIIAEMLVDEGVTPIWKHFRAVEGGMVLSSLAWDKLSQMGKAGLGDRPTAKTLDAVGLCREPYWHPLSEVFPDKDQMNLHAAVSLLLSTALFDGDGDPALAKSNYLALVQPHNPTMDFEKALSRARYDDRWLLKLTTLGVQAIEGPIHNQGR